ncbi:hypothetical protein J7T55_005005 [Diaporthe amygdali]|uniref:uncharacterized protein n=1 Tax=Phomopsis amygdali TaxID=1214568 RepID=UPI0022FDFB22|nr:uncharacterized protein J7T55_005005 [Diaporthe amygdali]KAJ0116059.1 hypothetical protein J7T55_005005 [Diaporthe amygdali]
MASITNANEGGTKASPDAVPKKSHNLSIVYIDHELDKPTLYPTKDEPNKNGNRPNWTLVYIDHHLDGPGPPNTNQELAAQGTVAQGRTCLFRLPLELRIMIWELILPGKRALRARAGFRHVVNSHRESSSRDVKGCQGEWFIRVHDWNFRYDNDFELEIPKILQICRESRGVALQHGSFVFRHRGNIHDTGIWWNSDLDVLGFDKSWDLDLHRWALGHLDGLEHVKHVAIDENQARSFWYDAGYGDSPWTTSCELREPLAVKFRFLETPGRRHYILEFFPHFQQLTIIFMNLWRKKFVQWMRKREGFSRTFVPEEDTYSTTFRLGSDIKTAVNELTTYRKLCMQTGMKIIPGFRAYGDLADGPIYSVKSDDIKVDDLGHWIGAGFEDCQIDGLAPF